MSTNESNTSGSSAGVVPAQYDGARSGVPFLGEVSTPGWAMARLSLLSGEELQGLRLAVLEDGRLEVALHGANTARMQRLAGDLGFGVDASRRTDHPRGHGRPPFTAFRWKSSRVREGIELVWFTDLRTADLAVKSGAVTLPPTPAGSSR